MCHNILGHNQLENNNQFTFTLNSTLVCQLCNVGNQMDWNYRSKGGVVVKINVFFSVISNWEQKKKRGK